MGWIQELENAMSKNNKLRYSIYIILVLIITAFGTITYILIKNANNNNGVRVGPVEVREPTKQEDTSHQTSISFDTTKNNTSQKDILTPKNNKTVSKKPTVKQENKEGDNNDIGRDNNGIQGNSNSHNHIVTGNDNKVGINGDVNIGNMPKEPTQEMLSQIEDSIKNKQAKIYLTESTTNLANRTFCKKLSILLNENGYSNVYLDNYTNTRLGTCPESGIHISGNKNGDFFTICVSEE